MSTPPVPRRSRVWLLVAGLAIFLALLAFIVSQQRRTAPALVARHRWTYSPDGFANSLGMGFVRVTTLGLLIGETEVRVREFRAFVEATEREWPQPDLETTPEHPAVNVTWEDARDFCVWLTDLERERGLLTRSQEYRLPTDAEWSGAAGLAEDPGATPAERSASGQIIYTWGSAWPPPAGAGNFAGEEAQVDPSEPGSHIAGYRDAFPRLAPAAQFTPNQFGLYDLAGNALEWCEDWFSAAERGRVMRGGSWLNGDPQSLALNHRAEIPPRAGFDVTGFRCVLAPVRDARSAPGR